MSQLLLNCCFSLDTAVKLEKKRNCFSTYDLVTWWYVHMCESEKERKRERERERESN